MSGHSEAVADEQTEDRLKLLCQATADAIFPNYLDFERNNRTANALLRLAQAIAEAA